MYSTKHYPVKKAGLSLFTVLLSTMVYAQSQESTMRQRMIDSIKTAMLQEYAKTYNVLRQVTISNDLIGTATTHMDLYKNRVIDGKLLTNRTQANINLPVAAWKNNLVNLSLNYSHQYLFFSNRLAVTGNQPRTLANERLNTNTYGFNGSFVRRDSLFHLPVTYSLSMLGLTSESGSIQKLSYMANLIFTFKQTATTRLSAGGIVIIDPSSLTPFIPVVSYWHQFAASHLELIVDLPQRALLRKQFNRKNWVTLGTEITASVAFLNLAAYQLPQETNFSTFELKNGITFEHQLTRHMVAGISGGVFTTVSSRLFSTSNKSNDYFISNKNSAAPYVNVSLSFLPFLKPLIR